MKWTGWGQQDGEVVGESVGVFNEDMTNGFGGQIVKGIMRRVNLLKSLK